MRTAMGGRMKTGFFMNGDRPLGTGESMSMGAGRPMTSVRAAGFSSNLRRGTALGKLNVDAGQHGADGTPDLSAPPLEPKAEDCPEFQIKEMEKKVRLGTLWAIYTSYNTGTNTGYTSLNFLVTICRLRFCLKKVALLPPMVM